MSAAERWVARAGELLARIDPPPGVRRLLRIVGYPAFGFLVALMTFGAALPADKVKSQLETMLSAEPSIAQPMGLGVDVKIGALELSILRRGAAAENVVLRTRPFRDKPTRYVLDAVRVNLGILGALFKRPTYDFEIEAYGGTAEGSVHLTTTDVHYSIESEGIDLSTIQGVQGALGVPIEGKLGAKVELDAPGRLLASSNGTFELDVDDAAVGDGKAKLVIPGDPFLAQGVTLPRARLGKIEASIDIEKGRAHIETFHARSPDLDITIEGDIDLRDPIIASQLHLFLRVKASETLLKKEPTIELLVNSVGSVGKRSDGYIGAQITGLMSGPRFQASRTPPPGVTSKFEEVGAPPPGPPPPIAAPSRNLAPPPPPPPPPIPQPAAPPVVATPPAIGAPPLPHMHGTPGAPPTSHVVTATSPTAAPEGTPPPQPAEGTPPPPAEGTPPPEGAPPPPEGTPPPEGAPPADQPQPNP